MNVIVETFAGQKLFDGFRSAFDDAVQAIKHSFQRDIADYEGCSVFHRIADKPLSNGAFVPVDFAAMEQEFQKNHKVSLQISDPDGLLLGEIVHIIDKQWHDQQAEEGKQWLANIRKVLGQQ